MAKKQIKSKKAASIIMPPLFSEISFKRYFNMYNAHQRGWEKIPAKLENIKIAKEELTQGGW